MKKKYMKDAMGLTTLGIAGGVGMSTMASAGASTAGLAKITAAAKPVGSIIGAGMVIDSLGHLQKSVKPMNKKKMY